MNIFVVGAPCSGIHQMARLLQDAAYRVGCECLNPDGIVRTYNGGLIHTTGFSNVYHLARNPCTAIPLLARDEGFSAGSAREARIISAAYTWYSLNKVLRSLTLRVIRIDELSATWPIELMKPKTLSTVRLYKAPQELTMNHLHKLRLTNVLSMAKELGYDVSTTGTTVRSTGRNVRRL